MKRVAVLLAVALMMLPAPALAYDAPGPRWPGGVIRYHETLPRSWEESLERAVSTWNRSGVQVRFREVDRARAQVLIGYGSTNGNAGQATIGRRTGAFLHMEPLLYRPLRPRDRTSAAIVLAHELGHVLGLGHAGQRGCRLMASRPLTFCPNPPQPWFAYCRWLSRDDVRGALSLYGGRDRRPASRWCLREPQPPALPVTFDAGGVAWPRLPVLPRTRVRIEQFPAQGCTGEPVRVVHRPVGAVRWSPRGPACLRVGLVNRYGMPGPTTTGTVA
jgi:hypothetical protein